MYKFIRRLAALAAATLAISCLAGCTAPTATETTAPEVTPTANQSFSPSDLEVGYQEDDATTITCLDTSAKISGSGAEISGGVITITQGGLYVLSGSLLGQLRIQAGNQEVQLVLDGLSITSQDGPALWVEQAEKTVVLLSDGTVNSLTDSLTYTLEDGKDEPNACLYSKGALTINGEGTLDVTGSYHHGIFCKDTLSITGGVFHVTAANDGVKGKDGVKILAADMTIQAGGDGIQSNEDQDPSKGYVFIGDGTFQITAASDGIQAESTLQISGGSFHVTTGGGSSNAPQREPSDAFSPWEQQPEQEASSSTDSAKGLKAGTAIEISGGVFQLDTFDDAVHSNGTLHVTGGEFTISTGDDGFHSDGELTISDGIVQIDSSYEGIESMQITISGGEITLKASDDGLNSAGGSDETSAVPQDRFWDQANADCWIRITGGILQVDAGGDGLDSNGGLYVDGGCVFVNGPTSSGDGALDYGSVAEITGGIVIAAGNANMAAGFGETSSQYSFLIAFSTPISGGTEMTVADSEGNIICTYTPTKDYQSVVVSTPELVSGGTYTVKAGEQTEEITLTGMATNSGRAGEPGGGMPERPDGFGQGGPGEMTPPDEMMPGGQPPADNPGGRPDRPPDEYHP